MGGGGGGTRKAQTSPHSYATGQKVNNRGKLCQHFKSKMVVKAVNQTNGTLNCSLMQVAVNVDFYSLKLLYEFVSKLNE